MSKGKKNNPTYYSKKMSNHNGGKTNKYGTSPNDKALNDDDMPDSPPSTPAESPPSAGSPPTAKPASPPPFTAASDDFPLLPKASKPTKTPFPTQTAKAKKPKEQPKNHTRDRSDEVDYDMIDSTQDTELEEEGVLVDAADADEKFEMVPDAKHLPREDDLEDIGKPFAGRRAWGDAQEKAAEGKEGEEGGGQGKKEEGEQGSKTGRFWGKEGDAKRAGK